MEPATLPEETTVLWKKAGSFGTSGWPAVNASLEGAYVAVVAPFVHLSARYLAPVPEVKEVPLCQMSKLPLMILFLKFNEEPFIKFGVVIPVVPLIVTGIILILYTTVHTDPAGTVTLTPAATVIGPAVIAFLFSVIV